LKSDNGQPFLEIKRSRSKTFAMFVKQPESEASATGPKMTRYENQWKQVVYYIEPGKTKVEDFVPLFERAYRRLTGA
jgi:hypothetical protein